jgi:hypothetical protein
LAVLAIILFFLHTLQLAVVMEPQPMVKLVALVALVEAAQEIQVLVLEEQVLLVREILAALALLVQVEEVAVRVL